MDQQIENKLLNKLKKIQLLDSAKETILQYARYVNLLKFGKIKNIGNCNVLINCKENYIDRKALTNIIVKILNYKDVHYLSKEEIDDDVFFDNAENDVFIIDSFEQQTTIISTVDDLKNMVNRKRDKVFIVISGNFTKYLLSDSFSWYIEIEPSSVDDKQTYILNKLKDNNIKISASNSFISKLACEELDSIDYKLINIIIDCKMNNLNTVDKTLKKKHCNADYNIDLTTNSRTALQQLDELIGLDNVKKQIHQIVNYVKVHKNRGKLPMVHMCFEGNSGCGKNIVAKLLGQIFKEEKILTSGKFVEVSRADLVGEYVGQTAQITQDIINSAKGGVLFIDEAYSLDSRNREWDYGAECISTLIKYMEDYRDNLCVILAGYIQEMERLLKSNRGFSSRIQFKIKFDDYTADELYQIFRKIAKEDGYKLGNVKSILIEHFEKARKIEDFGNGRYARSLFEKAKFEQADRCIVDNTADINTITKVDILNVIEHLELNMPKEIIQTAK